ncbi:hypothetical protein EKO29_16570 [Colwellia sp. Arc7-635]|uniref:hypothetical protein n=1 Tax=Colwellia sp. Arc7-635 TaxID=2497879 RepID=UPI000F85908E|nr:hypothetical protein [Colwellia sp. Arc7-635]AZQ85457.1 hypothetical protein EKO29_16570 [Colwellia sp. Arc7-635]
MINFKYLNTIYNQYKKTYFQVESGALIDRSLSSDLISQYHYGSFILAAVLVSNQQRSVTQLNEVKLVLGYLRDHLDDKAVVTSIDFNIESLCIAHWVCECTAIKLLIENELERYACFLTEEIEAQASDYYLLRYFNINYINLKIGFNIKVPLGVSAIVNKTILSKDVLFDSYTLDGNGIPDLTYHCRNMQILQLCVTILGDNRFLDCIERGIAFISRIASDELEACGYGRSPETIYGYSSLLLVLSQWSLIGGKLNFESLLNKIYASFFTENIDDIKLVFGSWDNNQQRCGYDSYMYPIVYKYYALSKIMLSLVLREKRNVKHEVNVNSERFFYSIASGFLKFKSNYLELSLNTIGHFDSQLRPKDSRYLPCIPFLLNYKGGFCAPHTPFSTYIKTPKESIYRKYIRFFSNRFFYSSPLHVGFHPVFKYKNNSAVIIKSKLVRSNELEVVSKSTELSWYADKIGLFKKKLKSKESLALNIQCHFKFHQNEFEILYQLTEPCNIEYSIRINEFDSYQIDENNIYVNGLKIISLNMKVERTISIKLFKCTGGFARVIIFLLSGKTNNLSVKY